MKRPVILSIRGTQRYEGQEQDTIELVTEGSMEQIDEGWELSYEESDLTGLAGVTTVFCVEGSQVTLRRCGKLNSRMVFREGIVHESLYRMEFGALLMTVCAQRISYDLNENGGYVDLIYSIQIEHSAAGLVEYHLDVRPAK